MVPTVFLAFYDFLVGFYNFKAVKCFANCSFYTSSINFIKLFGILLKPVKYIKHKNTDYYLNNKFSFVRVGSVQLSLV